MNSTREKQLGIGRGWPYGVMKEGEIIIHKNVARQLGTVSAGDYVLVTFSIHWFLPVTHDKARSGVSNVTNIMRTVNLPFKITAITDFNYGKLQETRKSSHSEAHRQKLGRPSCQEPQDQHHVCPGTWFHHFPYSCHST